MPPGDSPLAVKYIIIIIIIITYTSSYYLTKHPVPVIRNESIKVVQDNNHCEIW
jgi:hypothetical protein